MLVDFQQILKSEKLPPVIMLFGQEEFLIEEAYNKLIKKFITNSNMRDSFDETDASEKGISADSIADMVSSVSLLSSSRIVAVKNFHELYKGRLDKKKNLNMPLVRYLNNPSPENVLIILAQEKSIDGATKKRSQLNKVISAAKFPYNIILEKHICAEFPKVWENQMPAFIVKRFAELNKKIDPEAAKLLLSRINPELRQIANEIDKVDIYYRDKEVINVNDINFLIGSSRNYNIFELQKQIGLKKSDKAIFILHKMMEESKSETPIIIVNMLARYFMVLWKLNDLQKEYTNKFQLAGKAGLSPVFVDDYRAALNNFSEMQLNRAFIYLADADEMVKTSSSDSLAILQNMIINIMD